MAQTFPIDLVLLVADKDIEQTVAGLCARHDALGVRPFSYQIFVHPERDPGCLLQGVEFLRSFQQRYAYAMILFDRMGSGRENNSRLELEAMLESSLTGAGWTERAVAIVLDPELEAWVWSDSPHVAQILGWQGRTPALRIWLTEQGFFRGDEAKPEQPKEAMEAAIRSARIARSSSLYRQLAARVTLSRCTDASFLKFKSTLQRWFR